jgi:hypothetical protein
MKPRRIVTIFSPQSSRSDGYKKLASQLNKLAVWRHFPVVEILLDETPYFEACQQIAQSLADGDLVLSAGGDGVAQATIQAVYESTKDVTVGCLPFGNANDLARALNGRVKQLDKILAAPVINFHPLMLSINNQAKFFVASYATFGATTVVVDWINSQKARNLRRRFHRLPPVVGLKLADLNQISQAINTIDFPDFRRRGRVYPDDSVGFFMISAAGGLLRLKKNHLRDKNFFFHSADVKGRKFGQTLLGKSLMASGWATFGLPGQVSTSERLVLLSKSQLICHIGGDNIPLDDVAIISAKRSPRAIKLLAPIFRSTASQGQLTQSPFQLFD